MHRKPSTDAPRRLGGRLLVCVALVCGTFAVSPSGFAADSSIRRRGIELAKVARSRAKAKSFKLAAQMFHEAYNIDRAEWRYLFSAGRCEQLAGMMGPAEKTYARFLKVSPMDHPLRPRAARELSAVRIAKQSAVAKLAHQGGGGAVVPAPPTAVTKDAQPGTWRTPTGWTAIALGVVTTAAGGALYGVAFSDKSGLEKKVSDGTDTNGQVAALTFADAQAQRQDIEGRLRTWGVVGGVGLGIAVVGAVLLATAPDRAQPVAALGTDGSWHVGWMVRF